MRRIQTALCFAVVMFVTLAPARAMTFEVDCDDGDDLGAVLNHLARVLPPGLIRGENTGDFVVGVTIRVSGTCVGNFVIANSGVKLEGVGPGPDAAVLQGAAPIGTPTP